MAKRHSTLPEPFSHVQLSSDFSAGTIQTKKKLARITGTVIHHKIPYKWGYPMKILVSWQGRVVPTSSEEAGLRLYKEWRLLLLEHPQRMSNCLITMEEGKTCKY